MVEAADISTRAVLSLVKKSSITAVEMPANTGDAVIYVANAATNPSADATSGHIYYSDSARPAWRFNGHNLRLDGTSPTASAGGGAGLPLTVATFIQVNLDGVTMKVPAFAA
jgi:hypothetical protein